MNVTSHEGQPVLSVENEDLRQKANLAIIQAANNYQAFVLRPKEGGPPEKIYFVQLPGQKDHSEFTEKALRDHLDRVRTANKEAGDLHRATMKSAQQDGKPTQQEAAAAS